MIQEKLNELRQYIGKDDAESRARFEEIMSWLKENATSDEQREEVENFVDAGLQEQTEDLHRIREQIEDKYRLLPMSYIARNYFGKSTAWLTQRINGHPVRGRVYTLNAEQKRTFNRAVQDIASKIGSVCIV